MKEAIGQTILLQVILVFMIFLNAFLAFSVNYTKAFRVKNKVINVIEQNEGITGTIGDSADAKTTRGEINAYTSSVGYTGKTDNDTKSNGWRNGIKVVAHCVGTIGSNKGCPDVPVAGVKYRVYYSVTTSINFHVPIIGPIFETASGDLNLMQVKGDTSMIYIDGSVLNDRLGW